MTNISTLGQALDQIERLKNLQNSASLFQQQLATGKKTDLFKGLGTDVLASKRARADFNMLDKFINNIDIANRRIKQMTGAIEEFQAQSTNVLAALEIQTQQGEYELDSVGALASNVREFLADLLNEKDGERYLLGGANTLSKPVTDTGALDTYIKKQIDDWVNGTITTDELINTYRDETLLTDTIVGYSAEISSGNYKNVTVRVEEDAEFDYTVIANEDAFRNLLVGVSLVKNIKEKLDKVILLPEDNPATTVTAPGATREEQNDNFYNLFNDIASMMSGGVDAIDTQRFKLSQTQAQMQQVLDDHKLEKNVLLTSISDVEDADMNEVALSLSSLQLQLEAAYRVTATMQSLNLINFLPIR